MGNVKAKKKISGEVKLILKRLKFRCIVVCGQKVEYFRSNNQPGNLPRQVKTYRFPRNYFSFQSAVCHYLFCRATETAV